jgi:hypothetical protein
MAKPSPRTVYLPDGSKIIPEHFHEGPAVFERFQAALKQICGVTKGELDQRETQWQRRRAKWKRAR